MLTPILLLVTWTLVIWLWMTVTRIPAMKKARIKPQEAKHTGTLQCLPSEIRQISDNYNHLLEQPTIFYALCIYMHLANSAGALDMQLAWAYVAIRVAHSLVQCTYNLVMHRFILFEISTLVLVVMAIRSILSAL